jgi:hypothetical protein
MLTGSSRTARGATRPAMSRSGCTAIVAVQVPEGQPGCAVCWQGAPAGCATEETTPPAGGGMAQPWEEGMAPNADDGASHSTVTARRMAITRLPALRAGLVKRFSRCEVSGRRLPGPA